MTRTATALKAWLDAKDSLQAGTGNQRETWAAASNLMYLARLEQVSLYLIDLKSYSVDQIEADAAQYHSSQ